MEDVPNVFIRQAPAFHFVCQKPRMEMIQDLFNAKIPLGDDLVGLQRAFMKSGAASVVSTLWEVDDESTSLLIKGYFKRYREGDTKATKRSAAAKIGSFGPSPRLWQQVWRIINGRFLNCWPTQRYVNL